MAYAAVDCFWVETTGRAGIVLRRFTYGSKKPCPSGQAGHDASSPVLSYEPVRHRETDHGDVRESPRRRARSNRAWPVECEACGYRFEADDEWQTNAVLEWRRPDTGGLIVAEAHRLPAGALLHIDWHPLGAWRDRYGDGINLYAVCPNGSLWNVDGPAINDGHVTTLEAWTRTGDPRAAPPTVSATPSIVAGDYHGWLSDGRLTDG